MAVKKLTKREKFEMAITMAKAQGNSTLVEFFEHEIELLDKKSETKGMTETQKANEVIKQAIVDRLGEEAGCKMTVSAMIKNVPACEGLSTSKVSALVRQLKDAQIVAREEVKGVAYFSLA